MKRPYPPSVMFPKGPGGKMVETKAWVFFFFLVLEVTSVLGTG